MLPAYGFRHKRARVDVESAHDLTSQGQTKVASPYLTDSKQIADSLLENVPGVGDVDAVLYEVMTEVALLHQIVLPLHAYAF